MQNPNLLFRKGDLDLEGLNLVIPVNVEGINKQETLPNSEDWLKEAVSGALFAILISVVIEAWTP